MVPRTILATLDGSAPGQRVQVSLMARPGGRVVIDLCEQHFAEGIGWFDQRTMALDPRQLRQLTGLLDRHPARMAEFEAEIPAILPFPGPRDDEPRRAAVGSEG